MNCNDTDRLFDAYLDGQLAGTLRLEFDAHRLRCRRCQQTLAMLESVGHVIATDRRGSILATDFTDRVMGVIKQRSAERLAVRRRRWLRVAIVAGGALQAAAVLVLAIIWNGRNADAPVTVDRPKIEIVKVDSRLVDPAFADMSADELREDIYARIAERLLARKQDLTDQGRRMLMYLNIDVPNPVAKASFEPMQLNPLTGWLDAMLAQPLESGEAGEPDSGRFAL